MRSPRIPASPMPATAFCSHGRRRKKAATTLAGGEPVEADVSPAKSSNAAGTAASTEDRIPGIAMRSAQVAHARLSEFVAGIGDPGEIEGPSHRESFSLPLQIPDSIRGDSGGDSAATRLVARQRQTASTETKARANQIRRKVMKCWRVNVS